MNEIWNIEKWKSLSFRTTIRKTNKQMRTIYRTPEKTFSVPSFALYGFQKEKRERKG